MEDGEQWKSGHGSRLGRVQKEGDVLIPIYKSNVIVKTRPSPNGLSILTNVDIFVCISKPHLERTQIQSTHFYVNIFICVFLSEFFYQLMFYFLSDPTDRKFRS